MKPGDRVVVPVRYWERVLENHHSGFIVSDDYATQLIFKCYGYGPISKPRRDEVWVKWDSDGGVTFLNRRFLVVPPSQELADEAGR